MKQVFGFLFISAFLMQCSSGTGKQTVTSSTTDDPANWPVDIPLEEVVKNEQEVRLSEIGSEIEYIPLETSDEVLISSLGNNILLTEDYIFTVCWSGIHQFDKNGKFIRKISRKGAGPGEYMYIEQIYADEANRTLYIGSSGDDKVLEYDFEGRFVQEFSTPISQWHYGRMSDGNFVFAKSSPGYYGDTLAYFTDPKGKTYYTIPDPQSKNEAPLFKVQVMNERIFYTFSDELKYKDLDSDTLFIVKDKEFIPQYVINLGKYKLPDQVVAEAGDDIHLLNEKVSTYYRVINVTESPSHLFFSYGNWTIIGKVYMQLAMYDKVRNNIVKIKDRELINDIDKIISFTPSTYSKGKLIGHFSPEKLMSDEEGNDLWKNHPQLKDIDEDGNPILMLVTPK